MDVKNQLKVAIESGKVCLGSNKTVDSLLNDNPKLVLAANNCPKKKYETLSYYCGLSKVPLVNLPQTSLELGSGLGRPHPISAVAVLDEGDSQILEATK